MADTKTSARNLEPADPPAQSGGRLRVGLFDSGVGGLSVLAKMLDVLHPPWSDVLYLADLVHFPYGPRPLTQVRQLALAGVRVLAGMGCDIVVVACNTAASSGVRAGSTSSPVPVLDIIGPGARHTAEFARGSAAPVIILGTSATVASGVWDRDLRLAGYSGPVFGLSCPHLANLIEEGQSWSQVRQAVRESTSRLPARSGGETVVLACTHYSFAAAAISGVFNLEGAAGPVTLVDPAQALVDELLGRLSKPTERLEGVGRPSVERRAEVRFLTTGRRTHFVARAGQLLNGRLDGVIRPEAVENILETALAGGEPG